MLDKALYSNRKKYSAKKRSVKKISRSAKKLLGKSMFHLKKNRLHKKLMEVKLKNTN
jgi:hypothetical protein